MPLMTDVTGERLEIGDDEIDLLFLDQRVEPRKALRRVRYGQQILRNGALVTDAIVDVSEMKPVDLGDVETVFQILQSAIKRSDVNNVALADQMCEDFLGPGGVAGAFSVDSIEDVGH